MRLNNTHGAARRLLALAVALGVGLVLGACSADQATGGTSASEPTSLARAADGATDASVDDAASGEAGVGEASEAEAPGTDAASDDVASEDADSEDSDDELPGWIADAFPIYPGSTVAAVDSSGETSIASFFTPSDDGEAVYQWFLDQYGQDGWTIDNTNDESMDLSASHVDGLTASVNVTQPDGLNASWVMTAARG